MPASRGSGRRSRPRAHRRSRAALRRRNRGQTRKATPTGPSRSSHRAPAPRKQRAAAARPAPSAAAPARSPSAPPPRPPAAPPPPPPRRSSRASSPPSPPDASRPAGSNRQSGELERRLDGDGVALPPQHVDTQTRDHGSALIHHIEPDSNEAGGRVQPVDAAKNVDRVPEAHRPLEHRVANPPQRDHPLGLERKHPERE